MHGTETEVEVPEPLWLRGRVPSRPLPAGNREWPLVLDSPDWNPLLPRVRLVAAGGAALIFYDDPLEALSQAKPRCRVPSRPFPAGTDEWPLVQGSPDCNSRLPRVVLTEAGVAGVAFYDPAFPLARPLRA